MADVFSGYPAWEPNPEVALSVAFDAETFDYVDEAKWMVVTRPVRHRVIVEGTIERVEPYLAAIQCLVEREQGLG